MLQLSQVLIANQEFQSFTELEQALKDYASATGEMFFQIDVKPHYPDTPDNWEDRLEAAFSSYR